MSRTDRVSRSSAGRFGLRTLLTRSLGYRRTRSLSALVALTVSAAVATTLLTLDADLNAKLHMEFRSFGANVVVTAPGLGSGDPLHAAQVAADGSNPPADRARVAAYGYAVAANDRGTPVVVAGVDFGAVRAMNGSWWQASAWPDESRPGALIGSRAAEFVGNERKLTLTYAGHSITVDGVARLRTGGDEDSRIYLPQAAFAQLTGLGPSVIEVQVPGGPAQVDAAMARLGAAFPQAQVAPVRALVEGESEIVDRTHALIGGAALLVALTVAISVLATLSASVLERRRDFALMRSLGGTEAQMLRLFAFETLALAAGGLVLGYALGSAAAWAIGEVNFGTAILPRAGVLPAALALNLLIAGLAALLPLRTLRGLEPAALLKGE